MQQAQSSRPPEVPVRRLALPVFAILLLLVAAAPASAVTPRTGVFEAKRGGKGEIQLGWNMKFTVDRKGRRITKLSAQVLENCGGSSSTTTIGPKLSWRVDRRGRFKARYKEMYGQVAVYTTLEGRFTSSREARGHIRQQTVVAGSSCDTGRLRFTVRR
jgi:hypothetical protein